MTIIYHIYNTTVPITRLGHEHILNFMVFNNTDYRREFEKQNEIEIIVFRYMHGVNKTLFLLRV